MHPVQESSGSLTQLEREFGLIVKGEQVPGRWRWLGKVFGLFYQKAWYSGESPKDEKRTFQRRD